MSIGYNWPGASVTDWVGARLDTQGLPGAGPVPLSERSLVTSPTAPVPGTSDAEGGRDAEEAPPASQTSPFDQFTIP